MQMTYSGKKKNQKERERLAQKRKKQDGISTVSKRRKQNLTKKLHVSSTSNRQNLAKTLKTYAMSNLRTKYKILQGVKIMQQKQIFDIQVSIRKRIYHECSQGYVSADSKEWLCNTCRLAIKKEQWPKLSIINGMGFP